MGGTVLDHRYDIIIYEPPTNKTMFADVIERSKIFNKIINIGGNIIVKIQDFKEINENLQQQIYGSFDIRKIFESNDFYLHDQIIYKNNSNIKYRYNYNNDNQLNYFYFMIFKKKK